MPHVRSVQNIRRLVSLDLKGFVHGVPLALHFRSHNIIVPCAQRIFLRSITHVRNQIDLELRHQSCCICDRCELFDCFCLLLTQDAHLRFLRCRHDRVVVRAVRDRLLRASLLRFNTLSALRCLLLGGVLCICQFKLRSRGLWLLQCSVKFLDWCLVSRRRNLAHKISVLDLQSRRLDVFALHKHFGFGGFRCAWLRTSTH